jgi:predicted alpha/beta-fold hydrolase
MPYIKHSSYKRPPFYQFNGHLQTIFPSTLRKIEVPYERERLELEDGDFVDLDWLDGNNRRLAILSHGLEGNSQRTYIKGMASLFYEKDWDVLAWNCRSCSEEMNRTHRLYNHGEIGDIGAVIQHALSVKKYETIVLVGYSMGGNITLKYLGTHGKEVPAAIKGGVAFSTPCDLEESSNTLDKPGNFIYKKKFLSRLKEKLEKKEAQFPGSIDLSKFEEIRVWRDFDHYFSAPVSGFDCVEDFYEYCSAKNFVGGTKVPTLLVNAQNDPILTPSCSPVDIAESHPYFYLETPKRGGHVGFAWPGQSYTWSEWRVMDFIHSVIL